MEELLKVNNLSISYRIGNNYVNAVDSVSFSVNKGDTLGIIGESGSGKTSIAMAIMGLVDSEAEVNGEIIYKDVDLQSLSDKKRNRYRWNKISVVFQNNIDVLNPVLTIHEQIIEGILKHKDLSKKEAEKKVLALLDMVGLDSKYKNYYPHQLSGGMRQRVLIAMALACEPELLIVDEPTTALDAVSKNEIVNLLLSLKKENKFTMIIISHELSIISKLTSKVMVMYSGCAVEEGRTKEVLREPCHTYTRGLLNSSAEINPYQDLWGIPAEDENKNEGGCPFYLRCIQKTHICRTKKPELKCVSLERKIACNRGGIVTYLEGKNISKTYKNKKDYIKACRECSLSIRSGEIGVLIGESGSGKTTLGNILSGIVEPDKGEMFFEGEKFKSNEATARTNGIQIIFQDPYSSTNSHFTIEQVVREPLDILKIGTVQERRYKVKEMLNLVQLSTSDDFISRKCSTLSGGQRQRIAIARSLILEPKLLIADEICSMLDPSTKANILRLIKGLQNSKGFSVLYITHDISTARKIADKVFVMYNGEIIENRSAREFFDNPIEEYSKQLIGASKFNCAGL